VIALSSPRNSSLIKRGSGVRERRDLSSVPERELIRLARQQDDEAFRELIVRTRKSCMGLAMSMLHNREDAMDELQNAFWNAYAHLDSFGQNAKFSTWVGKIVINRCLMRIRHYRRIRFVSYEKTNTNGDLYGAYEAKETATPEVNLGATELRRIVAHELRLIPQPLGRALELRFIQELSPDEIARQLNLSLPATKSRLHRAQNYLKDRMLRHCGKRGAATLIRGA
jgi:RNA polymerase sigma-70 factor, ECF subfamily